MDRDSAECHTSEMGKGPFIGGNAVWEISGILGVQGIDEAQGKPSLGFRDEWIFTGGI